MEPVIKTFNVQGVTLETDRSDDVFDSHTVKFSVPNDNGELELKWSRTFITRKHNNYDLWYYELEDLLYLRRVDGSDYKALVVMSGVTGDVIYTRYGRV